jgi:putative transposase
MSGILAAGDHIPRARLCDALGASRATFYRHLKPPVPPAGVRRPPRALDDATRTRILDELVSPRFVDRSPSEVYYTLLDEGTYLASERTMYRVLAENVDVRERRNQRTHPKYQRPELVATGTNQVWSWDISRLRTTVKWTYFYLYVLLDIFSRYVVGWLIARQETSALGKHLIKESIEKHDVGPGVLIVHADRGTQMTSKTVAQLLADLDVTRSFSRPHVSNDNPFSEAHFRTAKYHPSYPGKFAALDDALTWGREFFGWYNDEHRHSGIAFLTPSDVHFGRADEMLARRHEVLLRAYSAAPERFPKGAPKRQELPSAVYINPPKAPASSPGAEPAVQAGAPGDAYNERQRRQAGNISATVNTAADDGVLH